MVIFAAGMFLLYIGAMVCLVPLMIFLFLAIIFLPPIDKVSAAVMVAMLLAVSVGWWLVLKALFGWVDARLRKKFLALAPAGFSPSIELCGKFGKHQYLGISPTTNGMLLIDPYHNVTSYESMDLLQGYHCEESNKGYYEMTIQFNSYVVPSMTFTIGGDRRLNDLIAKLNYAMQGGGRQYGPEVAEASIQAFESLQKQYGIPKKSIANDLPPGGSTA